MNGEVSILHIKFLKRAILVAYNKVNLWLPLTHNTTYEQHLTSQSCSHPGNNQTFVFRGAEMTYRNQLDWPVFVHQKPGWKDLQFCVRKCKGLGCCCLSALLIQLNVIPAFGSCIDGDLLGDLDPLLGVPSALEVDAPQPMWSLCVQYCVLVCVREY